MKAIGIREIIKSVLILCISAAIVVALVGSFHTALRKKMRPLIGESFQGEVRVVNAQSLVVSGDVSEAPSLSADGRRVLLVKDQHKSGKTLLLWEEGVGFLNLSKHSGEVFGRPVLSGDGSRAVFLALQKEGQKKSLFFWEDGFASVELIKQCFLGAWHLAIPNSGERVLLMPGDKKAVFCDLVIESLSSNSGEKKKSEVSRNSSLLLTFGSRVAEPRLVNSSVPKDRVSFRISILDSSFEPSAVNLSDSQVATLSWRSKLGEARQKRGALKYKRYSVVGSAASNDVDGDRGADLLVYRRGKEMPFWRAYTLSGVDGPTKSISGVRGEMITWRVGDNAGVPVPGDYNGDGVLDLATFVPGRARDWSNLRDNWQIYLSKPPDLYSQKLVSPTAGYLGILWGVGDELPVPADYDNDGKTDIAVYSPSKHTWKILYSGGGFNAEKARLRIEGYGSTVLWGKDGDIPIVGDYDGDGNADLALWKKAGSGSKWAIWKVYFLRDSLGRSGRTKIIKYGIAGDIPVPADYNCDGVTDIAVYRPAKKSWYLRFGKNNTKIVPWGVKEAYPIVSDYDGDGCDDPAFFAPQGYFKWHLLASGFSEKALELMPNRINVVTGIRWGSPNELPPQVWLRRLYKKQVK